MIWSTFKLFAFFSASFLILALPFKGDKLFNHLYTFSGPYGKKATQTIIESAQSISDFSIKNFRKLFNNSLPDTNTQSIKVPKSRLVESSDYYTEDEKKELNRILKSSSNQNND